MYDTELSAFDIMNTFQSSPFHAESVFCLCYMLPEGLSVLKVFVLCLNVMYLVQSVDYSHSFPSVLPSFLILCLISVMRQQIWHKEFNTC